MEEIKIRVKIEGLKELTDALRALAGVKEGQDISVTQPTASPMMYPAAQQQTSDPQQAHAPVAPPAPITYVQPSVPVSAAPVGTGMQMPGGNTVSAAGVPTTAMPQDYTIEQLQVAAAGLSSMGKMPQLMGILQQFGIQAMTELPKERYGEFATALRGAGAQI